jgi:branched-subunit amino acid aminotransferase/4-amino-4-deoxychorismate lyase
LTTHYCIFNGQFFEAAALGLTLENRAFQFGDGLFESICVQNARPLFLEAHFKRMQASASSLRLAFPPEWTVSLWQHYIEDLCLRNKLSNARIKIVLYRAGKGTYFPTSSESEWLILGSSLAHNWERAIEPSLKLCYFNDFPKTNHPSSLNKTLSSLLYVLAAQHAQQSQCDEAILLTEAGNISECSSGSLFWVKNGILYTPSLATFCLPGVLRNELIHLAKNLPIEVREGVYNQQSLAEAEEVFVANAIRGIRMVKQIESIEYSGQNTCLLIQNTLLDRLQL